MRNTDARQAEEGSGSPLDRLTSIRKHAVVAEIRDAAVTVDMLLRGAKPDDGADGSALLEASQALHRALIALGAA